MPPSCLCGECRKCKDRIRKAELSKDPESRARRKARDAARRQTPEHKEKAVKWKRNWRENNYEKWREYQREYFQDPERKRKHSARQAVNNAIRDGRMEKEPCSVCGTWEDVQAHHEDYDLPFDVVWLCRQHHAETHRA